MPRSIMLKSLFVNSFLVITKVLTGFIFRSTALIADGIHSLSDLISDLFVLFGLKQSIKPPDHEHPFGHGKIEYVLSLFIGISILFLAYQLISNVVMRLGTKGPIPSIYSLVVVVFVVIVKYILSQYLMSQGKKIQTQIIIDSGKESLVDVVSSVVVLTGIGATLIGNLLQIEWLTYGDSVAGLLIGILIIRIALVIISGAVKSLLGKSASAEVIEKTKTSVALIEGVLSIDQLTMIVYGHYYQVMIDISVKSDISVKAGHDIASEVKQHLKQKDKNAHVIVHVNPKEE